MPLGLRPLFPRGYGVGSPGLFYVSRCPFGFFSWRFYAIIGISVGLLHLGGDPCRSVGDQPPLPSPRGDPARLGSLSADPPLVVLLLLLLHSCIWYNMSLFERLEIRFICTVNCCQFHCSWIRICIPNTDPSPGELNPCGSGSSALVISYLLHIFFHSDCYSRSLMRKQDRNLTVAGARIVSF